MLNILPYAFFTAQRAMELEVRSALPNAPVVADTPRSRARPRTYRTRAALATRLARVADAVAPGGLAPAHRPASR